MKRSLVVLACLLAPAGAAVAETLVVDDQVKLRESTVERPSRGATMQAVERKFGPPNQRHNAVGGGGPKRPPITRWDYTGFSVFFENDRVIHSVALGG
jgi:hypothetical protein